MKKESEPGFSIKIVPDSIEAEENSLINLILNLEHKLHDNKRITIILDKENEISSIPGEVIFEANEINFLKEGVDVPFVVAIHPNASIGNYILAIRAEDINRISSAGKYSALAYADITINRAEPTSEMKAEIPSD